MKLLIRSLLAIFICVSLLNCGGKKGPAKLLVFSKTAGFVHSSIPTGIAAIQKLASENGMEVDTTTDASKFNDENLQQYSTVVFLNTTGDVLDFYQEVAFQRYIQAGGGFVGVHAATDTEYGWSWYGELVGAYFKSHPQIQEAKFNVSDHSCDACSAALEAEWITTDELYNFKNISEDINIIMSVDESSYEGGENGDSHPMAWYHNYDGGRAFYTALGHTDEAYADPKFLGHLLAGIKYAVGDNQKLDYSKATVSLPSDPVRFTKIPLSVGEFYEPTEMALLPDGDILVANRRGDLMLYKEGADKMKTVATLDVYATTSVKGVNAEEGFMGLQADPNFAENNWLYTFYAPKGDESVNRLSRFKFTDDELKMETEQIILDVASDRDICCHTGGSIAFGPGDILYLSTGDNSTPFNEPDADYVNNGFAPLNDLSGKKQYDARRSSGNTNDLRGKILRIKVKEDGSYDIPDGNLFPPGTAKTRPEIFTMGHRNPYRISVDPKHGWVYWGDVGPDAREDKLEERGPRGYDEHNVAREAGNYGWPLFIADNQAYFDYDYSNGKSGVKFDPDAPINDSENNTGLRELPPAQPAYLYYDYGESTTFDGVTSGGRNAMAGPTFYKDLVIGESQLPAYYDGKVFVYDWMRGWIKAVTFREDGSVKRIEPFASDIEVSNLIDMEIGPDGRIYLLEYGSGWFTANDDSALGYIKYNADNLPPTLQNFYIDKSSGNAPLTVKLSVEATDAEEDALTYIWDFGDGNTQETTEPSVAYTYADAGSYNASVKVLDAKKMKVESKFIPIVSGNSRPELEITLEGGNSSFFIPGVPVNYKVSVSDEEDDIAGIDPSNIFVTVDYMEGFDQASLTLGHQQISPAEEGEGLVMSNTCKTCHKKNEKSIGPTYADVAAKYAGQSDAADYLVGKIIGGGNGVWGDVAMPANPTLEGGDADKIVAYILSLAKDGNDALPPVGSIIPREDTDGKTMVVTASYLDRGAPGAGALKGVKRIALSSNTVSMAEAQDISEFNPVEFSGMNLLIMPKGGGHFSLEKIDMSGVKKLVVGAGWQSPPDVNIEIEARLGSPDGELIGTGRLDTPAKDSEQGAIPIKLTKEVKGKDNKIYFVYNPKSEDKMGLLTFVAVANVTFEGE